MKRREFLGLVGSATLAAPRVARAQQTGRVARVLFWMGGTSLNDPAGQRFSAAFRNALRAQGWEDGRNVRIEERALGSLTEGEQVRAAMAEFGALEPDVIVTTGAPMLAELHQRTKTVPIVFTMVTDPVRDGFVASLARPGGNITGFTIFEHSFAGKWLEMLKEVSSAMTRVAVLQNPDHPAWNAYLNAIRMVAGPLGVEVTPTPASNPPEVTAVLDKFAGPNSGLIILPSAVGSRHRELIASTALKHRMPSIYSLSVYPTSGGLMSYGVVQSEVYVQAAAYVDRILKGAKAGDLPVQAATKFELVINQKTANALGITVPATMLGRADEVIE